MRDHKVFNLVFSSSATVYGKSQYLPLDEKHPVGIGITNPYGQTKFFIEQIIRDVAATDKVLLSFVILCQNYQYIYQLVVDFFNDQCLCMLSQETIGSSFQFASLKFKCDLKLLFQRFWKIRDKMVFLVSYCMSRVERKLSQ